jgi:hypothetical protein
MEVSGQFHAPATLPQGKKIPAPNGYKASVNNFFSKLNLTPTSSKA